MDSPIHMPDIEVLSGICDDLLTLNTGLNYDSNNGKNKTLNVQIINPVAPKIQNIEHNVKFCTEENFDNNISNNIIVNLETQEPIIAEMESTKFLTYINNEVDCITNTATRTSLKTRKSIFSQKRTIGYSDRCNLKGIYLKHYRDNLSKNYYVCEICNKRFSIKKIFNLHYRKHKK